MKSLALYIDKWYIVGAVCIDGMIRPLRMPNHEDRIWLYFREDITNDEISYSKGFQIKYRNKENHYYGDVFSQITSSSATFTMFKHPQPMRGIFKSAKIFDDLRANMEEDGDIDTFVSFSMDISPAARSLFLDEFSGAGFVVRESVARIEHLALEYVTRKSGTTDDGYYLVLNACNENLRYSLYQKSEEIFVRKSEDMLVGYGTDVRSRALIEHVVDSINNTEHFLKDKSELEAEYLRMTQYVDDWLVKLSNARPAIPVQITGITLSNDSYKDYAVRVQRVKIDNHTEVIVKSIVDVITKFIKESGVSHEQFKGVLFLGNTFTNLQFHKELCGHYNLPDNRIILYKDTDLPSLVSAYTFIDCSQFSAATTLLRGNAEAELQRIKNAEEEAAAARKAQAETEAEAAIQREATEAERKFRDAMDKGYDSECEHEYDNMVDYFKIASELRPDNEEARQKYNEALQLKAKDAVLMNSYKEKIQQAKNASEEQDWETAKQKAEEALSYKSDSREAQRIRDESSRHIKHSKELERYLDRADLFIAQKAYKEALEELNKAKLLDVDDTKIMEREARIAKEQHAVNVKIAALERNVSEALSDSRFDAAINCCNELIELDFANSRKWSARIADIKAGQEKSAQQEKAWKKLLSDIDSAQWNEDWERVAGLCLEALEIKEDLCIREKLDKTQEKVKRLKEIRELDDNISEIKDLILNKEFGEARQKLNVLRKMKLNPVHDAKVKELNRLIFEKEDEPAPINTSGKFDGSDDFLQPAPRKVVKGFAVPQPTKPVASEDDFNFDFKGRKPNIRTVRTEKTEKRTKTDNDFFDSAKKDTAEITPKTKTEAKGQITNDDFNF